MVEVSLLGPGQYEEVGSLYKRVKYRGKVAPGDLVVGAYMSGQLVGAVRLVSEDNFLVLRGMHVLKEFQHQGIGFGMLEELQNHFGDRECWCIPYVHLRSFYSRAGFVESSLSEMPDFLIERLKSYTESGLRVVLMKRTPNCLMGRPA